MNIIWEVTDNDVKKVKDFLAKHQNPLVASRFSRNINHQNIQIDKNSVLKCMIMCLLTSQQRSGPNSPIEYFLNKKPFPLTEESISTQEDPETFVRETLQKNGLTRYINRIPNFFIINYNKIQATNWTLLEELNLLHSSQTTVEAERALADNLDEIFKGFGPKQARNFLQALGLTKFEIPIDSRITSWLNDFGFPVSLSSDALQDKGYYNFVSDGIQNLCHQADIFPCVLDAAIFSSFDKGGWTVENTVY